jgi:hypothetical protein
LLAASSKSARKSAGSFACDFASASARANASLRSAAFGRETGRVTFFANAGVFRGRDFVFVLAIPRIKALTRLPEKTFVLDCLACKVDKEVPMENSSEEKELERVSFIIHATRGVLRDQKTRRKSTALLLVIAVLMLLAGFTVLQSFMNPREHPWFVILFWVACVWLTFTALLLALFDLLIVRLEARRAHRALREKLERSGATSSE